MCAILVGVVALVLPTPAPAQGILARTRYLPPARSAPAAPSTSSSSSTSDTSDPDDPGLAGLLAAALLGGLVVTSPFWAPAEMVGDNPNCRTYFPGHPYALGQTGYLAIDPTWDDVHKDDCLQPDYLKFWGLRFAVEDGHDFSSLNRTGSQTTFDTASRWGVSSRWDYYLERLGPNSSDETTLGDFHVTYRIAQADWIQMHAGLGGRWRFDDHTVNGGVSFLYSADVFLCDPVVFSASVDLGNLDKQFIVRGRASVGVQFDHCELLAGYDFLRLGDANLQGPFAGLRLWF